MRLSWRRGSILLGALLGLTSAEAAGAAAPSRVITRGGAPWIDIGGAFAAPRNADVETRGRALVAAVARAKVTPASLVLSGADRFGDGETIVRYGQSHRGLPVIGRGASVRLSATGRPIATVVDLEDALPARVDAAVAPEAAARLAAARTGTRAGADDAHLVVWPTRGDGTRLAYAVLPRVPAGVPTAPRVIVDAETGEVLEVRDMVTFAKASMYPSNPTKTPTLVDAELAVAPTGPGLTNPLLEASNCVDKKTVKPLDLFGLSLKVHICDLVQLATANADGDYVYPPADDPGSAASREDPFSEVSIYAHASKAYAFFRDLQGDAEAEVVLDKPLRLVANLRVPAGMMTGDLAKAANPELPLEPFQNAFFSPASGGLGSLFQQLYGFDGGALWFGQGPKRDYAYDGDVVYHEFSHAVVGATLDLGAWHVDAFGAVASPGAMNEGLADYFSSAITGDPEVGEYAAADLGATDGSVLRTLANEDACPTAVTGEVHFDSTLFSGGLWQARRALPEIDRRRFDAALYKAMRANPGSGDLGYDDLTKLFLATLQTDLPAGAAALEAAMTGRGVLPACDRVLSFEGGPVASPSPRIGFVAPGKQSVKVRGFAPGIVQVRAAVPPGARWVTVSFTARAGGALPIGGGAEPFTPVVLAKLGAPITWDPKSKEGHDADVTGEPKAASGRTSATLAIPEGASADAIYVQIASVGDSDGAYDRVTLAFDAPEPEPAEQDASVASPDVGPAPAADGCSASGPRPSSPAIAALLGALALAAARRRRR